MKRCCRDWPLRSAWPQIGMGASWNEASLLMQLSEGRLCSTRLSPRKMLAPQYPETRVHWLGACLWRHGDSVDSKRGARAGGPQPEPADDALWDKVDEIHDDMKRASARGSTNFQLLSPNSHLRALAPSAFLWGCGGEMRKSAGGVLARSAEITMPILNKSGSNGESHGLRTTWAKAM